MKPTKKKTIKNVPRIRQSPKIKAIKTEKHLRLPKIEVLSHPKTHKCSICDDEFPDKTILVEHFTLEHATKKPPPTVPEPVQCDWCPQQFPNVRKAFLHRSAAHRTEANSFECQHCAKIFGFSFQLAKHTATEHHKDEIGYETHICEYCRSCYSTVEALRIHQKLHNAKVEIFVPRPSRRLKLNANSEVTPVYYCPHCASEYILKYNLRRHIYDDHGDRIAQRPGTTDVITCRLCDAVFLNKKAFNAHNTHSVNDIFMPESGLPNLKVDLD